MMLHPTPGPPPAMGHQKLPTSAALIGLAGDKTVSWFSNLALPNAVIPCVNI